MWSRRLCPMRRLRMDLPRMDLPRMNSIRSWQSQAIAFAVAEDIVSNFRNICIVALTAPLLMLFAEAAAAQIAAPADQPGKVLAGLRPPHEHHKLAHAKTGAAKSNHNATGKIARKPAKRRSVVAASSTAEVPREVAK